MRIVKTSKERKNEILDAIIDRMTREGISRAGSIVKGSLEKVLLQFF